MALTFPSNPATNDEYTDANGILWICTNSIISGNSFTSWSKKEPSIITNHNDLLNIQGGAPDDLYHLTVLERDKLTNIEPYATSDQTKTDIDALGVDATTLEGSASTAFALVDKNLRGRLDGTTLYITTDGTAP